MIEIRFRSIDPAEQDGGPYHYRVLDTMIATNIRFRTMRAFSCHGNPGTGRILRTAPAHPDHEAESGIVVHDRTLRLGCRRRAGRLELDLDDHTRIRVDPPGGRISISSRLPTSDPLLEQLALGPGLVFLETHRAIHFLHGSALATPRGVVIFTGHSGSGKSTLAAALGNGAGQWRRLADDVVACITAAGRVGCLPRFPQPKLAQPEQPSGTGALLPIAAIFSIDPGPGSARAALDATGSAAQRAMTLINHVMGSGTGDPVIERNILDAVSRLVSDVPGGRLVYPHGPGGPAGVRGLVAKFIAGELS